MSDTGSPLGTRSGVISDERRGPRIGQRIEEGKQLRQFGFAQLYRRGQQRVQPLDDLRVDGGAATHLGLHLDRQPVVIVRNKRLQGVRHVPDRVLQRGKGAVVHPRTGQRHVAQRRRAEREAVVRVARLAGAAQVDVRVLPSLAGTELRHRCVVEILVGQQVAAVAARAARFAVEKQRAVFGVAVQCAVVAGQIAVPRAVQQRERVDLEGGQRVGGVLETQIVRGHVRIRRREQVAVFRHSPSAAR